MSKRKADEKHEDEDVEMKSHDENDDEDDSGSDGEDIVNVDFEFFDPKEIDFHAVKNLLNQYFSSDNVLFSVSELSDLIIQQANVGTTIKVNGVDSDPYSLLTVLNMNHHLEKGATTKQSSSATAAAGEGSSSSAAATEPTLQLLPGTVMQQLKSYILQKSKPNKDLNAKIQELLKEGSTKHLGLILSDRFINMPVETAPPMWRMMLEEVKWAVSEGLPFNFEYYLLMSPTYHEVEAKGDLGDDDDEEEDEKHKQARAAAASKPSKKKKSKKEHVLPSNPSTTFFFHPEEEMLQQYAEWTLDFKLTTPSSAAESKNTFEDYGIAPGRRMMLIHKTKIPQVVDLMTKNSW